MSNLPTSLDTHIDQAFKDNRGKWSVTSRPRYEEFLALLAQYIGTMKKNESLIELENDIILACTDTASVNLIATKLPAYIQSKNSTEYLKIAEELAVAYIRTFYPRHEPAIITYSPLTGRGSINGKDAKLKTRNRRIFSLLVRKANRQVTKAAVWKVTGRGDKFESDPSQIIELNTDITNLRRKNITAQQLRLKKNHIILWAVITITDDFDLK